MLSWHFFASVISASMVTTPSFSSWYFIFKCTVDGTAPTAVRVRRPRMQLYVDSHGITRNCTSTVFFEFFISLFSKVTGKLIRPHWRTVDPLKPCSSAGWDIACKMQRLQFELQYS
ncbi:hypothetical protein A2U01_0018408 [Trifolium medium]|uniref:Secreted protein n=1 Tax=Trifolium medium TaxID=97028 RepID=A0A392NDK8_9FABA|nr:hypothetical protein [Trifolium medium]